MKLHNSTLYCAWDYVRDPRQPQYRRRRGQRVKFKGGRADLCSALGAPSTIKFRAIEFGRIYRKGNERQTAEDQLSGLAKVAYLDVLAGYRCLPQCRLLSSRGNWDQRPLRSERNGPVIDGFFDGFSASQYFFWRHWLRYHSVLLHRTSLQGNLIEQTIQTIFK